MRTLIEKALFAALPRVAALLPEQTYHGRGGPYLSKHTLVALGGKHGWRLHLHHFHRSDEDAELHSHPWALGLSLVLAGGYSEVRRRADNSVVMLARPPGTVAALMAETFHRVDLYDERRGCWTLFLSGPVVSSWGFWSRRTHQYTPWRQFVRAKGLEPQ